MEEFFMVKKQILDFYLVKNMTALRWYVQTKMKANGSWYRPTLPVWFYAWLTIKRTQGEGGGTFFCTHTLCTVHFVRQHHKISIAYIYNHRKRMGIWAKAKVVTSVASVWRAKFVKFLALLAVLSRLFWKKRLDLTVFSNRPSEFNRFFQINWGKTASAARNWTNSAPKTDAKTFALPSVSILLLCL